MRAFYSPDAPLHDAATFFRYDRPVPHPESVARFTALKAAAASVADLVETPDHGLEPLLAVHDAGYLDFLATAFAQSAETQPETEELLATQFAPWKPHHRPTGVTGLLGYYMTDTSTMLRKGTWAAVYGAAQAAVSAADALATDRVAYALCRPPGHHASTAHAGGFCYLNNAAIAAERLRTVHDRVAILDVDVHHGNGTQEIFYEREDVLFVSVHADPSDYFPYFLGYDDEAGAGAGLGRNLNIPLPLGTGDEAFLSAIAEGLDRIEQFKPGALVVSLGLDAGADDPIGAFQVSEQGFERISRMIAGRGWPTVLVQEGGYPCEALSKNLVTFITSFEAALQA